MLDGAGVATPPEIVKYWLKFDELVGSLNDPGHICTCAIGVAIEDGAIY